MNSHMQNMKKKYSLSKSSGILIPENLSNLEPFTTIKRDLVRKSKGYNDEVVITSFYEEIDGYGLLIPRYYPVEKFLSDFEVINILPPPKNISIESKIVFRDSAQESAFLKMKNSEACVIKAKPATGKTVISIHLVCDKKLKTMVLVHRSKLVDQWRDRFFEHSTISRKEISTLTSQTYKNDLQKDVIICTDQTFISLLKRDKDMFLKSLLEAGIGVFIADEVHTSVGAPTFSKCSIFVPSYFSYGLSATPYRWDGNSDIIKYHLGPIYSPETSGTRLEPKVICVFSDLGVVSPRPRYIFWGGRFHRPRYLNMLRKSNLYISICKGLLKKSILEERDILFINERLKLIDIFYDFVDKEFDLSCSKFISGSNLDELEKKVTFATPQKIRDGIDAPKKDCLIMSTPVQNVEQLAGRISRILNTGHKKQPIFIDIIDIGCTVTVSMARTRIKEYKRQGWGISYYRILNSLPVLLSDETAEEILNE